MVAASLPLPAMSTTLSQANRRLAHLSAAGRRLGAIRRCVGLRVSIRCLLVLALATGVAFASAAGAEEIRCPAGTEPRGAAPPQGGKLWCALPDGTQHGPSLTWYADGQRLALASFQRGALDGSYREWHPGGQLKEEGEYRDDRRDGVYRTFYANGKQASEEEYRAGLLHGRQLVWYESGAPMAVSEFRHGKRHGLAATWYEGGQKQTEGRFVDGSYHGRWVGWWEDGSVKKVAEFDHGRELSREFHPRK
jgi:antitoxin component YwqK of YwqJK toxin-antitoxin module